METALLAGLFNEGIGTHYLVEADGAARRPIKGYASYEPVIPPAAGLLLPVLGLDALGKKVESQTVHRVELFAAQCGAVPGDVLDEQCQPLHVFHACAGTKRRSRSPHNTGF